MSLDTGAFVYRSIYKSVYVQAWSMPDSIVSSFLPGQFSAYTFVLLSGGSVRSSQFALMDGKIGRSKVFAGGILTSYT